MLVRMYILVSRPGSCMVFKKRVGPTICTCDCQIKLTKPDLTWRNDVCKLQLSSFLKVSVCGIAVTNYFFLVFVQLGLVRTKPSHAK